MTSTLLKDDAEVTGVTPGWPRQAEERREKPPTRLRLFPPAVSGVAAELETTAGIGNRFYERFLSSLGEPLGAQTVV